MTKKSPKKRIEIIDLAKCIAIIMVILGHTSTNAELLGDTPFFIKVLYSIHMPLFFFLSGMSMSVKQLKTWSDWRYYLRKDILTIAIPFLIWGLVFCNFNFKNLGYLLYGSWNALGKTGTVTSLWYLSCLFVARIIAQIVIDIFERFEIGKNRLMYLVPSAVLIFVGAVLPGIEAGYPWCFNVALVATGFILMGVALKKFMIAMSVQNGWMLWGLLLASIALYAVVVYFLGDSFKTMLMCKGDYGAYPLASLALAVFGGAAVLILSMRLVRLAEEWLPNIDLSPLIYLGQHTMGVFLLHKPMLQSIFMPLFTGLLPDECNILARLLSTAVSLILSMMLNGLIEYYIPELVGIFSKDKIAGENKA